MSREQEPRPSVDFFNSILKSIIEPSEKSTSLLSLKIHLNTLNLGIIYDSTDTLPEQLVIIQDSKQDPATLKRRTLCIALMASRFTKITYESSNRLEEEMQSHKELLKKRKNPPPLTSKELSAPSTDINTLKEFAREAQIRKNEEKEQKYKIGTFTPMDIIEIISGLSLLSTPPNLNEAENVLTPVFNRQFQK